jgi:Phage major capsid protein E
MATLDIFNEDAFSVSSLSQTIVDIPQVQTILGSSGLFKEYGITTTSMMIERQGSSLRLVPTAPRGGVGQPVSLGGRSMIPVAAVHLPQTGSVMADEVQGVRAFGSETEVQSVMSVVKQKLTVAKGNLDLTLEYHRIGAIKGLILDADGVSPVMDMYATFNVAQQTKNFILGTVGTRVKDKITDIKRMIRTKLGGRSFTGVDVLCSAEFFDSLTRHATIEKAYELFNQNSYARTDQRGTAFTFADVTFREYLGGVGTTDFIPAGEAYAYPTGVSGLFQTAYAPAPYMETVNTTGLPYYAKQQAMPFNKGIELESQSNPINFCSLPETVVKCLAA